jgi:hypothetical protein
MIGGTELLMDTRIVALTAVIFIVGVTPMPEARARSSACIPGVPFDPTNPTSAGFGLVFSDDFTNPQTIDLTASGNAGFNWYLTKFFGYGTEPASTIAITPDGLVLTPSSDSGGNWNIATAAPANNTQGYVGQAFGGGAYFEAKIKFDPTTVNFSQGFPALWGFSIEHAQIRGPITLPERRPGSSISSRMTSSSLISAGLHPSPMGLPFTIGKESGHRHARKDISRVRLVSAT